MVDHVFHLLLVGKLRTFDFSVQVLHIEHTLGAEILHIALVAEGLYFLVVTGVDVCYFLQVQFDACFCHLAQDKLLVYLFTRQNLSVHGNEHFFLKGATGTRSLIGTNAFSKQQVMVGKEISGQEKISRNLYLRLPVGSTGAGRIYGKAV